MKKGKSVVVLDRYSKKELARYASVNEASEALDIPTGSIYSSICMRISNYECFFVYERDLQDFKPRPRVFRRVRNVKVSEKVEALRASIT